MASNISPEMKAAVENQTRPEVHDRNSSQRMRDESEGGKHEAIICVDGSGKQILEKNLSLTSSHWTSLNQIVWIDEFCTAIDALDSSRFYFFISQTAADVPENVWETCILWAFGSGNLQYVTRIMESPVDIENLILSVQDIDGYNSLHRAILSGNYEIVNMLGPYASKSFSFLHSRTKGCWTALHLAVCIGNSQLVKLLTSWYDGHGEYVERPMTDLWDFRDNFWMTPLHYAVLKCSEQIVVILLSSKAYVVHVNELDYYRRTAFHIACYVQESASLVSPFLDHGDVDLNVVDCCAYTPLHWAVYGGNPATVRAFISRINTKGLAIRTTEEDIFGQSPLELAVERSKGSHIDDKAGRDMQKLLFSVPEVKDEVDMHYRDRQVYIDAANAILVGAALIASVTFAGWFQPVRKYDTGITIFWLANNWSFCFSMATVMAGAATVLPMSNMYIGEAVRSIRLWLRVTSALLLISVLLVLGTFSLAGMETCLSFEEERRRNFPVNNSTMSSVNGSDDIDFGRFWLRYLATTDGGFLVCLGIAVCFTYRLAKIRHSGKGSSARSRDYPLTVLAFLSMPTRSLADFQRDLKKSQEKVIDSAPKLKTALENVNVFRTSPSELASSLEVKAQEPDNDPLMTNNDPLMTNIVTSLELLFRHNSSRIKGSSFTATATAKKCLRCSYISDAYNNVRSGLREDEAKLKMRILSEISRAGLHYWKEKHVSHECFSHRDCRANVIQNDKGVLSSSCEALERKKDDLHREQLREILLKLLFHARHQWN